ncbi:AI-2E family transporter [Sedimenticola sp.]|uniref:AI-2E family transporter n=1 Tax=Sedimenticola sp. TaxID=1940285 RepID=UPI00258E01B3|nr:AI-2E family transporter [Sedimenticola sp.]MCW8903825.1 AI-2E family transporter [Sedimenticola sp.]
MNTTAISVAVPGMPDVPSAAEPGEEIIPVTQAAAQDEGNPHDISPAAAIRLPVDARGLSLGILSTVAIVFALNWAQGFVISLLLGILFAYTLNPLVVWLERVRIPRVLSASIVMIGVIGTLLLGSYALQGQVQKILAQLPETTSRFSAGLASMGKGQHENIQNVQAAATEVEKATSQVTGSTPKPRATHVVIDPPAFKLNNYLWAGSKGVLGFAGQAIMVVFLVYFLLLSADTFKRKLVRLTGPSLSRKKITVHILDDINKSIQNYMFMLLVTNMLVALLSWLAFRWIGLENAGAWAVAAGLLHLIPYFGPAVTAAATGMAAFLQFGEPSMVLLVVGLSLAIATTIGTFVTTWMTGRIAKMNTAAIFISLLFWGWLWGIWGMLLSIPIIVIMKVVSQHVVQLQPVAELLGE